MSESKTTALADCPRTRGGPSTVQSPNDSEKKTFLGKLDLEGWTVRTPWADRPSFTMCNPPETSMFLSKFEVRGGPSASQGQPVCLTFHSAKTGTLVSVQNLWLQEDCLSLGAGPSAGISSSTPQKHLLLSSNFKGGVDRPPSRAGPSAPSSQLWFSNLD